MLGPVPPTCITSGLQGEPITRASARPSLHRNGLLMARARPRPVFDLAQMTTDATPLLRVLPCPSATGEQGTYATRAVVVAAEKHELPSGLLRITRRVCPDMLNDLPIMRIEKILEGLFNREVPIGMLSNHVKPR